MDLFGCIDIRHIGENGFVKSFIIGRVDKVFMKRNIVYQRIQKKILDLVNWLSPCGNMGQDKLLSRMNVCLCKICFCCATVLDSSCIVHANSFLLKKLSETVSSKTFETIVAKKNFLATLTSGHQMSFSRLWWWWWRWTITSSALLF